ncbi:hypothetical protein [Aquirufa sp.]|jgi:hypothetical protein|uniref:hypothetical protein n=1 Tax=Aquirufa sp. TaxID=2676249 RepID=UPI003783F829
MEKLKKDQWIIGGVILFAIAMIAFGLIKDKVEKDALDTAEIKFYNFPSNKLIDTNYFVLSGKIDDPSIKLDVELGKLLSYSNGNFKILIERKSEDAEGLLDINLSKGNAIRNIQKKFSVKFNRATKEYLAKLKIQELKKQKVEERAEFNRKVKDFGKKAGKIKTRHPEWSWEDCSNIADNKIWIGMDIEMLVYIRGRDFSRNVSNYGGGNQYQYCWMDYTPSCFYDNDGDGKIESYN